VIISVIGGRAARRQPENVGPGWESGFMAAVKVRQAYSAMDLHKFWNAAKKADPALAWPRT
jgi:hypothetical protein